MSLYSQTSSNIRIYICLKPKLWAKDRNTALSEPTCTYTYCAFSNFQYFNVHRLPLCGNCTCVPQWLSYKVVRRPSPWGTWTFQITFPGERGGFLFTMTLPSKRVSATFEALFFIQVKRLRSGMENKYLHPFISLATLHCTAVSISKTENVSSHVTLDLITHILSMRQIALRLSVLQTLEIFHIVQSRGSIYLHVPNSSVALGKEFSVIFLSVKSIKASLLSQCCA